MDMDPTCLFTGVKLSNDTKEEHCIPRSMVGRIRSRIVTSSEFNNECGSFCDDAMRSSFSPILSRLSPLLSSEYQPGLTKVAAGDAPPGLFLEPGGRLTRLRNQVLERDENGRPTKLLGKDVASLQKLAKSAQIAEGAEIKFVPMTCERVVTAKSRLLSDLIELTALKSLLLSFDHLVSHQAVPFTRSDCLEAVRSAIRDSVRQNAVGSYLLSDCSMGIQIDRLAHYECLRQQMGVAATPFEHYMLVSANREMRCIDGVWVVFGFEPHGFRLCNSFDGAEFCYGFVNPVVKGTSATELIELPAPHEPLCCATILRSFHPCKSPEESQALGEIIREELWQKVIPARANASDLALYLSNTRPEGDEWLVEQIRMRCGGQDESVCHSIVTRLQKLFVHVTEADGEIAALIDCDLKKHENLTPAQTPNAADADATWEEWLMVFRGVLDEMVEKHGLPNSGFLDARYKGKDAWDELDRN